jgi:small-conductance mechanosensitive channel
MDTPRSRAKKAMSAFYLTLISIIGSFALGFLLSELKPERLFGATADVVYWLQATATLQMIFLMWHEYVMGTIFFRWVIGYVDSVIPFTFGLVLFATIRLINRNVTTWLLAVSVFASISCLAYINQLRKARRERENKKLLDSTPFHRIVIPFCLVTGILFLLAGAVLVRFGSSRGLAVGITCTANLIFLIFSVVTFLLRWRAMNPAGEKAESAGSRGSPP